MRIEEISKNAEIINLYTLFRKIKGRANYFEKIVEFESLRKNVVLALKSEVSAFTCLNLFVSKTPPILL